MSNERAGLLVTGSHRSGSTWVGRMLASADNLHYVQEPFNIVAWQRWLTPRPDKQFLYLNEKNGDEYAAGIQRIVELRYPLAAHLRTKPGLQMAKRAARITSDAAKARRNGAQPLVKDPIALFSSEWLQDHFGLQPVVLVRDPVAFVGSLKERDWTFDFRHWADQPLLMSVLDETTQSMIVDAVNDPGDIVDQGILQWNVFYDFVANLRDRRPETVVVGYERLALDPTNEVAALFDRLGLDFGTAQQQQVTKLTTAGDGQGSSAIDVHRRSDEAVTTWRSRLDEDAVAKIRNGTDSVAARLADL